MQESGVPMGLGVIVPVKVLALGTVEYRVTLQRKRQIPITILGVLQPTTILSVPQRKRLVDIVPHLTEATDAANPNDTTRKRIISKTL